MSIYCPGAFQSSKTADSQTQNSTCIVQSGYDDQLIHRGKSMTTRKEREKIVKARNLIFTVRKRSLNMMW